MAVIALDFAATTPVKPEVAEAMAPYLSECFYNPSSVYRGGKQAQKALTQSRTQIAEALGADTPEQIRFTGCATESNNTVLKGLAWGLSPRGRHIITCATEHPSILEPLRWLKTQGFTVTELMPDENGFVSSEQLSRALQPDTILVSLMHGNNEVGTIQDIAALTQVTQPRGILFHTDAVQTLGKIAVDWQALGVDALSGSAHKLYGPKGVGILALSERAQQAMVPLLHGGGQEFDLRSGTQNVAGAVGMAKALTLARLEQDETAARLQKLVQRLYTGIVDVAPQALLNGPSDWARRLPGNLNMSFPPATGEALVLRFDLAGIYVSSGSACHQGEALVGSHVLEALGADAARAQSSIRFSLGRDTTETEIDAVLTALPGILSRAGALVVA